MVYSDQPALRASLRPLTNRHECLEIERSADVGAIAQIESGAERIQLHAKRNQLIGIKPGTRRKRIVTGQVIHETFALNNYPLAGEAGCSTNTNRNQNSEERHVKQ